jgi:deazaflavin-dependent oxidoreductase (nitroreductase family)
MWKAFNRIIDAFIKSLLRSPFHGILSKRVLLITVTGHKSGKRYTFPVEYGMNDGTVIILSHPRRTWWRNIRGPTPVRVWIQRQNFLGTAELLTDNAAVEHGVRKVYLGKSVKQVERFHRDRVVICVQLEQSPHY